LHAVVTQQNPVALIRLYSPDGKKVLEVDTRDVPNKPTQILWVADSHGEYIISVSGTGRLEVKLEELRAAGPDDRKRVEADRLLMRGISERRRSAYDQAILTLSSALDFYRIIQDREREVYTLTDAGAVYRDVGETDNALVYLEQALAISRETKNRIGEGRAC
jgi:hypothetical protein